MKLVTLGKRKELYPLYEQINYLRQLYKYASGENFIDSKGHIFKYKKTSKLNKVECRSIKKYAEIDNYTVFQVEGLYQLFYVDYYIRDRSINYASIMNTEYGPFLYDLVKDYHDPYRRKI